MPSGAAQGAHCDTTQRARWEIFKLPLSLSPTIMLTVVPTRVIDPVLGPAEAASAGTSRLVDITAGIRNPCSNLAYKCWVLWQVAISK